MNKEEKYIHFDTEDFLHDIYFLKWMRNEDPEVNAFWKKWEKEHPEKMQAIKEAIKRYQTLVSFDPPPSVLKEQEEVWHRIESAIQDNKKRKFFRVKLLAWSAAAMVALLLAGGWFIHQQKTNKINENFLVIRSGKEQKKIMLADSSTIFLDRYTTLKYHPGNGREFWLNGQAFFDVKHQSTAGNAAVPFTLHAGIEKIIVLGTAFTVKNKDSTASVVLIHGKVKATVGDKSMVMKPGEKTEWHHNSFSSEPVNPQLYLAWKDGEFHFDHTSLKELAELIKDYYGYDLIVKNKIALKMKTISGTVTAGDEETLWKTLSLLFDAKVEKHGKQIILTAH